LRFELFFSQPLAEHGRKKRILIARSLSIAVCALLEECFTGLVTGFG
jgi:hypothetical protein